MRVKGYISILSTLCSAKFHESLMSTGEPHVSYAHKQQNRALDLLDLNLKNLFSYHKGPENQSWVPGKSSQ